MRQRIDSKNLQDCNICGKMGAAFFSRWEKNRDIR